MNYKRARPKVLEQPIKNAILEWLSFRKEAFAWPNASTGIWDAKLKIWRKPRSNFHINGVADILGIWDGKPLAIEVKSPTGVLSDEQKVFLKEFQDKGGIAIVARSVDDVIAGLGLKAENLFPR